MSNLKTRLILIFLFALSFLPGTTAARAQNNPLLTLNKSHLPAGPQVNIGTPITYVITLSNAGAPNANVSVTDTLPPGFVVVGPAACTSASGATCPGSSGLVPPVLGNFNLPTGGSVVIKINGYFTTAGPKTNLAVAGAKDGQGNPLPVGNANTSQDSVTVPTAPIPTDIKVEKCVLSGSSCVSTSTVNLPAHLHYQVTVTNTTGQAVYLGGLLTLKDVLSGNSSIPLTWTASSFSCTPSSASTDCPDLPPLPPLTGTLQSSSATIPIRYDQTGASTANDAGYLPGNASYKVEFDVDLTTAAQCKNGLIIWSNQASLDLSSFGDQNPGNNTSLPPVVTTINTNLPDCPRVDPVQASKVQTNPTGNSAPWNTPVTYRVTFTNPAGGTAMTNMLLTDSIYKTIGTPPFQATLVSGPTCVAGCSTLTSPTPLNPMVSTDNTSYTLWKATLPSLAPGQQAVIEYKVTYAPVCETDPRPDVIVNQIYGGGTTPQVTTSMKPEAPACALSVRKTQNTPGPIVFGQPASYTVVFTNNSASPVTVGTVRDVASVTSNQYGSFAIDYQVSCTATAGTITPVSGPPLPITKNLVGATVTYQQYGWQGLKILDENLTFGPQSTLTCQITLTAHPPRDDNPYCQGAGDPQLRNSALMDVSPGYNPNDGTPPGLYSSQAADLPLCRSVIVTKVANPHNYGPGAPVTYTITVVNVGKDPLSSFSLTDNVVPPLVATSVTPCSQPCSTGPTLSGNNVNVQYGVLQPNQPVSFNLNVTAPQQGGSDPNLAQGAFPPGGNFYFQGDESHFLQQEENIQVITPVLAKSFNPGTIGPNGTATLLFTITNTNSDPKQTGMAFSDTLPPGLQVTGVTGNGCGGTVTVSTDGQTITLAGGQLIGSNSDGSGKHSCQIAVQVKATGVCGDYRNNEDNFKDVKNLDVSSIDQHLKVVECPPGLTITKQVPGAPAGFHGQFTFLVQCQTPNGFHQETVVVNWPTPGFVTVTDIPSGSDCTVTEGPPPAAPVGYNWQGLPVLSPKDGPLHVGDTGVAVTATDAMSPCNQKGQVTIRKIIKGLPASYTGVFQGTLQCWIGGHLTTFPVTLTAPNGLTSVIGNIPLGSTCTFQETVLPPLTGDLQWLPPVYSPDFGSITLTDTCCVEITVTNEAHPCCTQHGDANDDRKYPLPPK